MIKASELENFKGSPYFHLYNENIEALTEKMFTWD